VSARRPDWAPAHVDIGLPNAARIYDYFLGGTCNLAPDREFADKFLKVMPEARMAARENRAFLGRAVRFCVEEGIRQFLDVGSGIPTVGNVHEIAQGMESECRVLYLDNDPVAVAHSELMLQGNERAAVLQADLCDPETIFGSQPARRLLDLDQPMALLMVAVLHFVPNSANPLTAIARYINAIASGSFFVLSHGTNDGLDEVPAEANARNRQTTAPGVDRTRAEVLSLLDGTELVEPGMVWTPQWRPIVPEEADDHPERSLVYAAVGRKP
jgi:hypothetical protein